MATTSEGDALKQAALEKISYARRILQAAREDLCRREGTGYSKHYTGLQKHIDDLETFSVRMARLHPPTGVWKG